jgi:hypothetical protein
LVRDVGVVDDVCHVDEDFVGDASDGWEKNKWCIGYKAYRRCCLNATSNGKDYLDQNYIILLCYIFSERKNTYFS